MSAPVASDTSPDNARRDGVSAWREARWAFAGGALTTGTMFVVAALVGRVSAFQARRLVEGIKPTATFAASTYIGAGATILALMATMIGFSTAHDSTFRHGFYRRLRIVASGTTALIVVAILLLTVLGVPIADAEAPSTGYLVVYWSVLGLGSIASGLTVMIVLSLNDTVRGLIELGRSGSSHLTVRTDEPATEPDRREGAADRDPVTA